MGRSNSGSQSFNVPFPMVRAALRSLRRRHGGHEAMEVVYRDLFLRDLARAGVEDRFTPVGAAANYSLLYLVLRCYVELPVRNILDVGAGQTSLLLDALQRRMGRADRIVTLEHDADWAARIGSQVSHTVLRRDLVEMRIHGRRTRMHDTTGLTGPFQLIIMDGPPGSPRYSRLGVVHLMQTVRDRRDAVVILDDVDRASEWQTVQACRRYLRDEDVTFRDTEIRAAKHQWLCATGNLMQAAYF